MMKMFDSVVFEDFLVPQWPYRHAYFINISSQKDIEKHHPLIGF